MLTLVSGRPIVDLFLKLPSKKLYPDYYHMIENPISLHEIRDKVVKGNYSSNGRFLADFELMYKNAQTYNEVESLVAKDAVKIYEFVSDQIHEYEEEQSVDDYLQSFKDAQRVILDDLIAYKVRGRKLSEIFLEEPSREEYPEYYQIIKNASSFNKVRRSLENNELRNIVSFVEAVELIFKNAKLFNEEGSQVYNDADTLQKSFHDKVDVLRKSFGDGRIPSVKLKVKPLPQTKLKINLKPSHDARDEDDNIRPIGKRRNTLENKAKPAVKDEHDDDENEHENGNDYDDVNINEETTNAITANDNNSSVKDETDTSTTTITPPNDIVIPPNITTRSSSDQTSLFQMINISTNIPTTSRYMQAKNPVPPANFLDVFQLIIPPSKIHTVRAYSFSLPAFHSTLTFSVDLHQMLHTRHYNLSLIHQGRRLAAGSSTSSNPFSDNSKPLKDRFELSLIGGLNHIELVLQASSKRDLKGPPARHSAHNSEINAAQVERLTFWITLSR